MKKNNPSLFCIYEKEVNFQREIRNIYDYFEKEK